LAFIPPYAEIKHPTVYKFITAMQKEQKNVRVRLCQIQAGDLNEDKTKYQVNKDKRILKLVQNYSHSLFFFSPHKSYSVPKRIEKGLVGNVKLSIKSILFYMFF